MFKEIRSLLQMLDEVDAPVIESVAPVTEPAAVDLPQSIAPHPPGDKASTFVFDSDAASAASLHTILKGSGVDAEAFGTTEGFRAAIAGQTPHLAFIDVAEQGDDAIDLLFAMGEAGFKGGVQLMGAGAMPVLDVVKRMGQRHQLQMLAPLKKPLDVNTVRSVLTAQNLQFTPLAPISGGLDEALASNWIEFWYQPKIDLKKRQIAGVETFARVRHPELGTLPPGVFMQGATEASLMQLTQRALAAALSAARNFSQLGINLRLAVNIPVSALINLPIADMVRELGPKHVRWPGLILDVTEGQVMDNIPRVHAIAQEVAAQGVMLAIDDFGGGKLPIGKLRELPFSELKLDRNFVNGCASDEGQANVCASVIDLAHHLGCIAVAVGIERATDMVKLAQLGCDLGQGYLFGQPMPEEQLVAALLKRAVAPEKQAPRPHNLNDGSLKRARWN
jgi:EAL domain-containing protein (putative c-di-GMP-specific phosphodiesterase class I)